MLPTDHRDRFREEWAAELEQMERESLGLLLPAFQILIRAPMVGRALSDRQAEQEADQETKGPGLQQSVTGIGLRQRKFEPGSFVAELTDDELEDLARRGRQRGFARGEVLFTEGELATWVAVLLSGKVKACSYGDNGVEVLLAVRGPGALLGEVSAIDELPRSATVSTMESVQVLVLAAEEFMGFLHAHGRVSILLMRMLCQRWRDADRKRIEFGMFDTTGRVAQRLVELAERYSEPYAPNRDIATGEALVGTPHEPASGVRPGTHGASDPPGHSSIRITLNLTQEELAGWVGASREAVSKALRTLRSHGWIETGRRRVIVHDVQALRRHAR